MSNYLENLPNEVLDRIVGYALEYHGTAPVGPPDSDDDRITWPRDFHDCRSWSYGPLHVKYLKGQETHSCSCQNLALVSSKFAALTKSAMRRVSSSPHLLDVMLVNDAELWPTWVYVPGPYLHVKNLEVTFRTFPDNPQICDWSVWHYGDGSPPQIMWCFYYLLERFVESGALAEHGRPKGTAFSQSKGATINHLTLDFVDCVSPTGKNQVTSEDNERTEESEDTEESVSERDQRPKPATADWLARNVGGQIHSLLGMGYHAAFYGQILHETVGSITIRSNGNFRNDYQIDRILKDLDFTDPAHTWGHLGDHSKRLPAFRNWKEAAYRLREEAGLSVIR